jgi:hypothetical protein
MIAIAVAGALEFVSVDSVRRQPRCATGHGRSTRVVDVVGRADATDAELSSTVVDADVLVGEPALNRCGGY